MMVYTAPSKLMYAVTNVTGLGTIEMGSDGEVFWQNSALTGPRILPGLTGVVAGMPGSAAAPVSRSARKNARTIGASEVAGEPCWEVEVRLELPRGATATTCYGRESGLALRTLSFAQSPAGEVRVETLLSDYRAVENMRIPHRMVQKSKGTETVTVIEKIEFPGKIDRQRFEPPAAVRELLARGETGLERFGTTGTVDRRSATAIARPDVARDPSTRQPAEGN
jgi:hypothetical protein